MANEIQKIREEAERLQKRAEHNFDISLTENERQFWLGESNVLTLIGKYIDSLQKEPVSEDLEQAIDTYLATYFGGEKEKQEWPFLKKMAIHFAEWQKQKDSISVSEDLEEVIRKYEQRLEKENPATEAYDFASAIRFGANWQKRKDEKNIGELQWNAHEEGLDECKQEMMAKAVETTFNVSLPSGLYDKLWIKGCKELDKLLVIKKDEL